MTKVGYVTILGLPNAGKSTLLNALLGQKLSIITRKPQTTRKQILGILTEEDYQIIFLDTPGILKPNYLLQEKMMNFISSSIYDADIILIIIDLSNDKDGQKILSNDIIKKILKNKSKPVLLLLNKIDLSKEEDVKNLIALFESTQNFTSVIPISALYNMNKEKLIFDILKILPEGHKLYPDDIIADASERFFVSEIIREKLLEQFQEEIPYSCEVIIAEFKEREKSKDFISAEIVVERQSQKGIIIGKGGAALKKLGKISRKAIEEFLGREVYLELRVKVRQNWRSDENFLKSFGYSKNKD
ncbi:MAG: GTPase Era [Bacteroidetes bacterium]|nr:GTPase Era [Bacteroidota bacterium]MCH8325712.1 GTPase Era [Bacteroidota bacterium]